jgi:phage/plasmid-like protein (TIGR03299 family)
MARRDRGFIGLKAKQFTDLDEACEYYDLDFDVHLRPIRAFNPVTREYDIPVYDKQAVERDDRTKPMYIATVGMGYHGMNYRLAFDVAQPLVDAKFTIEQGGAPDKGQRGYLVIDTGEEICLGGDDVIRNRVTLTSSHDGTGKIEVRMTPYRPKSGATLTLHERPLAFKHTRNVTSRIQQGRTSLKRIQSDWAAFGAAAKKMQTIRINDQEAREFIRKVMPPPDGKTASTRLENIWDDIYTTFKTSSTIRLLPTTKGTIFGAVQAFAEWADSRTPRDSKKRNAVAASLDMKIVNDGAKKKAKAWGMGLWCTKQADKQMRAALAVAKK